MPRYLEKFEAQVRAKHRPSGSTFLNEQLDRSSIVLCWQDDKLQAACFILCDEARAYPGFTPFPDNELDSILNHFPR